MGCTDEKSISGRPQKKINRNMSNINNTNENKINKKEINDSEKINNPNNEDEKKIQGMNILSKNKCLFQTEMKKTKKLKMK